MARLSPLDAKNTLRDPPATDNGPHHGQTPAQPTGSVDKKDPNEYLIAARNDLQTDDLKEAV